MKCNTLSCLKGFIFVVFLFSYFHTVLPSQAQLTSCSSTVSPNELTRNTQSTLTFTITNSSSEDAHYVGIAAPNSYFTILDATGSGWSLDYQDEFEAILSGGTIAAGQSGTISVSVSTSDLEWASESWEVKLDSETTGDNYIICSGSPSTSIVTAQSGDSTAPVISGITITNVKDTSLTVTWTTNEAASSKILYSTDLSFGSIAQSSSLVTSHSLSISSLQANTTYNFRIYGTDVSDNEGESSTNTFTTAAQGSSGSTVTITTTKTVTPTPTPTPIPDKSPPSVSISTDLSRPFLEPPLVKGVAKDAKGIIDVEYSIDSGKNWIDVAEFKPSSSVSFEFTPPLLDDNNYSLFVRAKDSSGNIGKSQEYTLIIDRLPPQVGAILFSIGPQILGTTDRTVYGLEGVRQKITLSAVGGPTNINIISGTSIFKTTKNPNNGLWSSEVFLTKQENMSWRLIALMELKTRPIEN